MKFKVILTVLISIVIVFSSASKISAGQYLSDKCDDYKNDPVTQTRCHACLDTTHGGDTNTWTAIGCLKAGSPKDLVGQILGWAVIVGGGIAFILIVVAGFQITTASGDAKRVKAAQELLTSAISGLLLIIFSILLLNFIGVKILDLETWFSI